MVLLHDGPETVILIGSDSIYLYKGIIQPGYVFNLSLTIGWFVNAPLTEFTSIDIVPVDLSIDTPLASY